MLIPAKHLRGYFGVRPSGVLHVGAHLGEEMEEYHDNGFGKVLWVEGQSRIIGDLRSRVEPFGDAVFEGVVWSSSNIELVLNVTNNSVSSSLYRLEKHRDLYPDVDYVAEERVTTVRLDEIIPPEESFDFLNLDIQGAELEALRGLGDMLENVGWVYIEVNREYLYSGIPLLPELDRFLEERGFRRVVSVWVSKKWGEALYIRRDRGGHARTLRLFGRVYAFFWSIGMTPRVKRFRRRVKKKTDFLYLFLRRFASPQSRAR